MKYRLWNKYKKCWETDCYTISRNGEVYFIDYGEICGCFPSKTHVLQRSLGLKDIYGIEFYKPYLNELKFRFLEYALKNPRVINSRIHLIIKRLWR